jgi:hypothetical protein
MSLNGQKKLALACSFTNVNDFKKTVKLLPSPINILAKQKHFFISSNNVTFPTMPKNHYLAIVHYF